jgi:2-dehydropantoate 2-reductase
VFSDLKITIVGSGAIGGMAGAYMAMNNEDVLFVDRWADHVDAINQKGLKISGIRGNMNVEVNASTPDELEDPLEIVIFATKSQHTEKAVRGVLKHITPETIVVSLQNGFNVWTIAKLVPKGTRQVIGTVPNWGAALVDPGHLEFDSLGYLHIGELDGQFTDRICYLKKLFSYLTKTNVSKNIVGDIWMKQVYFSKVTMTALVDAPIMEIWNVERCKWMSIALVQEAMKVPLALGVTLPCSSSYNPDVYDPKTPEETDRSLKFMNEFIKSMRYPPDSRLVKQASGVWWDIVYRKRKSETTGLTGAVVNWAKKLGVLVPANETMVEMIYEIEDGVRKLGWHNIDELELFMKSEGCVLPT